jgi:hypothetical protein
LIGIPNDLRKWLAFGSGVGIEIVGQPGAESLRVVAARVRPGGARSLGTLTIDDAQHHAASTWGTDYAHFVKRLGLGHVPATVLLPRRDVTVRLLAMPGVTDKDLEAAVAFQMEGLHPYPDAEAVSSWGRVPGTNAVLVAVTRRSLLERFSNLFAEAGIEVGSFTCSAAAIHSARHLLRPASPELVAYEETASGVEIYGESPARPILSALFDAEPERAGALAASDLRLESSVPLQRLRDVLGAEPALAYAAAVASACPLLALKLNLLPPEQRPSGSRAVWIPVGVLGCIVLLLAGGLAAFPGYESERYERSLNAEIKRITPAANRAAELDKQIETVRRRILLLDEVRGRSKADLDVLGELTRMLAPPAWANLLEITRTQVTVAGEAAQAAPLLQLIDGSPLLKGSEFAAPPARLATGGEVFRIRARREPKR